MFLKGNKYDLLQTISEIKKTNVNGLDAELNFLKVGRE